LSAAVSIEVKKKSTKIQKNRKTFAVRFKENEAVRNFRLKNRINRIGIETRFPEMEQKLEDWKLKK